MSGQQAIPGAAWVSITVSLSTAFPSVSGTFLDQTPAAIAFEAIGDRLFRLDSDPVTGEWSIWISNVLIST